MHQVQKGLNKKCGAAVEDYHESLLCFATRLDTREQAYASLRENLEHTSIATLTTRVVTGKVVVQIPMRRMVRCSAAPRISGRFNLP